MIGTQLNSIYPERALRTARPFHPRLFFPTFDLRLSRHSRVPYPLLALSEGRCLQRVGNFSSRT